jgi:RND family efflux transporter MFP subunit
MKKIMMMMVFSVASLLSGEVYATFDVVAKQEANLAMGMSGVVKAIYVDVGSHVKRGELLAQLDNEDLKASVELAKEGLNRASIEEKFARIAYERYVKVQNVVDATVMDQNALNHQRSLSVLNEAKAQLHYKKSLLGKTLLRAPFSGVITSRSVEVGEGVGAGSLFRLASAPSGKLIVKFDEKYLSSISKGAIVRYRIDGESAYKTGKISKVYPSVDPKTRKATAEVVVSHIASGLFGEAYVQTSH